MTGAPAASARAQPAPVAPIRTLIVDDVADLRTLYRLVLEASGRFEVVGEASDGDRAITAAADLQPRLVMLDVSMPHRDGMEALPDILLAAPTAKVVMVSGFEASRLEGMARGMGAAAFLEKGLSPGDLVAALLAAVGGAEPETAGSSSAGSTTREPAGTVAAAAAPAAVTLDGPILHPDDVTAAIAHELRTPLTAMMGMAETLVRHAEELGPQGRTELAARIAAQCRHLDGIVEAVLRLSGADGGTRSVELRPTDLAVSLPTIAVKLGGEHGGVDLAVLVEPGLPQVSADDGRLRQVLATLVSNAIAHSGTATPVRLIARRSGNAVHLVVADDGIGIPVEDRERVFERFVRLDQGRQGLGLGLPVARALVEEMRGSIHIASSGRGTEVVITLPVLG